MTDTLEPELEEQMLERIVRNQLEIKALTEETERLKGYYKERSNDYKAGDFRTVGKFYIKFSANQRIDDALARQNLTAGEYKNIAKLVVDSAKAKKLLTPTVYENIQKRYDNKVEVGLV